jgi:hypothetical protein
MRSIAPGTRAVISTRSNASTDPTAVTEYSTARASTGATSTGNSISPRA